METEASPPRPKSRRTVILLAGVVVLLLALGTLAVIGVLPSPFARATIPLGSCTQFTTVTVYRTNSHGTATAPYETLTCDKGGSITLSLPQGNYIVSGSPLLPGSEECAGTDYEVGSNGHWSSNLTCGLNS